MAGAKNRKIRKTRICSSHEEGRSMGYSAAGDERKGRRDLGRVVPMSHGDSGVARAYQSKNVAEMSFQRQTSALLCWIVNLS